MWTVGDGCDGVPINTRSGIRTHSEPIASRGDSKSAEALLGCLMSNGDLEGLTSIESQCVPVNEFCSNASHPIFSAVTAVCRNVSACVHVCVCMCNEIAVIV